MNPKKVQEKVRGIIQHEIYCRINELIQHLDEETSYDLQNQQADCGKQEIFSYWLVSDWLAERLVEQGEFVFEPNYLNIWGRATMNQGIEDDYVMEQIALEVLA